MKYRNYTIRKSGFNYIVPELDGACLAASVDTAKKWIDCAIADRAESVRHFSAARANPAVARIADQRAEAGIRGAAFLMAD